MQKVIYFFVTLFLLIYADVSAQRAELMSYPEVHRTSIGTIGVSSDGRNIISADVKGRIILWDTQEKKPIRVWNIKGTPLKAKIMFDNLTAAVVYQSWGRAGERKIKIQLLNIDSGEYLKDLDYNIAAPIKAFDFNPELDFALSRESKKYQQLTIMSLKNLVCIDLYKGEIAWTRTIDSLDRDVNYINKDILAVSNEGKLSFINTKDGSESTNIPFSLRGYKSDYVLNGYNIACFQNEVTFTNLADGNKTIFQIPDTIFKENIRTINATRKYTIFSTLTGDISSIGVYDNLQKKLLWYEPQANRITDLRIIKQWNEIAFVNTARRLIVISALTGEVKREIINVQEDAKVVHLSPDFKHILYAHLGDGNDGLYSHSDVRRTSYWNMLEPSKLVDIDKGYFSKAIYINNNKTVLCLHNDSNLSAINLNTLERKELTIPDPNNFIRDLIDFDFDEKKNLRNRGIRASGDGSDKLLLHSRAKSGFRPFEFNNADVESIFVDGKQLGIKKDGIEIYGDVFRITPTRSRINTQRNTFIVVDKENFEIKTVIYQKPNVSKAELFANGRYIRFIYGALNNSLGAALFDLEKGEYVSPDGAGDSQLRRIESDRNGNRFLFQYANGDIIITSKKLKKKAKINIPLVQPNGISDKLTVLRFREKEESIIYKQMFSMGELKIHKYKSNDPPIIIKGLDIEQKYRDISNDGRYLSLSNLTAIQFIDLEEQRVILNDASVFEPTSVFATFSSDNKMAISSRYDGKMRIWNLEQEKLAATVIISSKGEWVVFTPEGLFDASPTAMNEMYYVVGKDIVDLSQVKSLYWQTDLLTTILESKDEELRNVDDLILLPMFPKVTLTTSASQDELYIKLDRGSGGIGWVSFYINGVEHEENVNPELKDSITIQLSKYADKLIPDKPNILSVVVYNASDDPSKPGWLRSKHKKIVIDKRSDAIVVGNGGAKGLGESIEAVNKAEEEQIDPAKTRIMALIVGTSDYVGGPEIDLSYADFDADSMALAIQEVGIPYFGADNVIIHKLTSKDPAGNESTRANILATMNKISKEILKDDILFIFFSGHGISKGNKYYYLTKEASKASAVNADSGLDTCSISSDTIKAFIRNILSVRKVLVLDACYSGSIQESLSDIYDKTSMIILSSSKNKQKSFEVKELKQGILTYCMMDGMSGRAAKDNEIDIESLFDFVDDNVPIIADQYDYQQTPKVYNPDKKTFPLGRPNVKLAPKSGRKKIAGAQVMKPDFTDPGLSKKIDETIKTRSKDKSCPYMFVEKTYQDAIFIRGQYNEKDDLMTFNGVISQFGLPLETLNISGVSESELLDQIEAKLSEVTNNL